MLIDHLKVPFRCHFILTRVVVTSGGSNVDFTVSLPLSVGHIYLIGFGETPFLFFRQFLCKGHNSSASVVVIKGEFKLDANNS